MQADELMQPLTGLHASLLVLLLLLLCAVNRRWAGVDLWLLQGCLRPV